MHNWTFIKLLLWLYVTKSCSHIFAKRITSPEGTLIRQLFIQEFTNMNEIEMVNLPTLQHDTEFIQYICTNIKLYSGTVMKKHISNCNSRPKIMQVAISETLDTDLGTWSMRLDECECNVRNRKEHFYITKRPRILAHYYVFRPVGPQSKIQYVEGIFETYTDNLYLFKLPIPQHSLQKAIPSSSKEIIQ